MQLYKNDKQQIPKHDNYQLHLKATVTHNYCRTCISSLIAKENVSFTLVNL